MQYLIQEKDITKKKDFYTYIHKKYKLKDMDNLLDMINKPYPLVVDLDEKNMWWRLIFEIEVFGLILESI